MKTANPIRIETNQFNAALRRHDLTLKREPARILQINVGKKCNQICAHCHVNAGPGRTEIMARETMQRVLDWLSRTEISIVDITGGAPELNPDFRFLVEEIKKLSVPRHIVDRCNLTVLYEEGQENLAEFLAANKIEIIASLPCYSEYTVNEQRGDGVFEKSIRALQKLNALGYGKRKNLLLHLVYNPVGARLPAPQADLEHEYKRELQKRFGIIFNRLFAMTNMPIARFAAQLHRSGEWNQYQELLAQAFNPASVSGLMCRDTLNIGWRGEVYDCDFNQMLNMQWRHLHSPSRTPQYLWEIAPEDIAGRPVQTAEHCFGCTAGAGSGCGGALTIKA
jgi:radical SAM/Cys-rich protein